MLILTHKDFNKDNFLVSLEGKNLNKLFSVLKFKTNTINILNNNLGLLIETSEHLSVKNLKESQRHLIPLNDFGNAWNYFISSALTLIYYKDFANLDSLPNRFKSKNFLKSIMGFVEKQCAQGINHYHIVKLLWLIYERGKNYDLEFVIYCIKNPNNILRYTLYELMNPEMGNRSLSSRIEKLNHFGETIISVYQKQINDSKN